MVRAIDVLAYPAVQLLDVTGPVQVFASANDLVAGAAKVARNGSRLARSGKSVQIFVGNSRRAFTYRRATLRAGGVQQLNLSCETKA